MTQALSYQTDEKVQKNRWWILVAVGLFTFMSTLDGTIVNIALPVISKNLNISMSQSEWVVSLYLIVVCSFILFFGKLSDLHGKIKIFRLGAIFFIAGSLLSGFRVNLVFLLVSRAIQAFGAAMTMATNNGIITEIFPSTERGKALGTIGSFVALGSIAGPGLGGLILSHLSWSYIFWLNVPVGIIAAIIGAIFLPKDITFTNAVLDKKGSFGFALGMITLFGGIFLGQQLGFTSVPVLTMLIIGLISFIWFVYTENHTTNPLLQFNLFKNPDFSVSLLCALLIFITNFFFNVVTPFYLENALHLAPSQAGIILMILPVVQLFAAPVAGTLSDKIGPKLITFIGLVLLLISQIGYSLCNLHSSIWLFIISIAIMGLGSGIFSSPNNSLVMSSVEQKDLGVAGSINSLSRNLGMVIGISSATTILFAAMSHAKGARVTEYLPKQPEIFIYGMHVVFIISMIICLITVVLSGWRLFKKDEKAAK
ncbi:MFS transporter [Lactobacillus apis]|uniref:Multidrug-efflux transporter, major facilitator superfamily (MFS), EmrB family n=1 Tax=Lactobacillus apis TaxID=303541 RepID=A0A0F4LN52_9LACO|nr:MFS transporter [Lactobacillus apis]KJY60282.1 Multidrug-efflux transporter, major facilitator superfamily (MFS), EmrB family [Lactobacillus apis]WLS84738.1 MFS transporter [Lactobacillus apis]